MADHDDPRIDPVLKAHIKRDVRAAHDWARQLPEQTEAVRNFQEACEAMIAWMDFLPSGTPCGSCEHLGVSWKCQWFNETVPKEHRITGCGNWQGPIPF